MTKTALYFIGITLEMLLFQSCQSDGRKSTEQISVSDMDTIPSSEPVYKDTSRFSSEPGFLKMIRENYSADLKDTSCILVLTEVRGCNCGLLSFEEIDSALNLFKTDKKINTYWLLKGKDQLMTDKITGNHPGDILLPAPKRPFEEYGLFQNATILFEIRSASEISRWSVIQR